MFNKENRVYIFDWDDNIMSMPTRILVEKFENGRWVEDEVDTEIWAKVRNSDHYRPSTVVENPFIHFREDGDFINDVAQAIESMEFGPSFDKFKEAILYGNDFAIVTARGHSKHAMMAGVNMLICRTFTNKEYIELLNTVGNIPKYLASQEYWGVSSPDFLEYYETAREEDSTELRKTIVLEDYIERKIKGVQEIDVMAKLSIGFSDDDKRNVIAVKELKEELKDRHPNVHFVVYDTSNPEKVKKTTIK